MLLKKLICITMSTLILASAAAGAGAYGITAAAANEEIPQDAVSVTWEDSRIYSELSLGRYKTVTTFGVEGYEEIPFLMVSDYLDVLFEGKQKVEVGDGVMRIDVNGTEAVIDPAADTIRFEDPAQFRSGGQIGGAVVEEGEYNVITASSKNESVAEATEPLTISLSEYHLPVIPYEDNILMPFLALQNTFGAICHASELGYNGKDYYNILEAFMYSMDGEHENSKESPYMKAIYSGPFSEKAKPSEVYAEYCYYTTCLILDLTFGHKEEKGITTFDEYFTRMNAKNALCSTNLTASMTAQFMLFNYLFDSGHDAFAGVQTVFGAVPAPQKEEAGEIVDDLKESPAGGEFFTDPAESGDNSQQYTTDAVVGALLEKGLKFPEVAPMYIWGGYFDRTKPEGYGDERLDYAGDTAVIYFKSFKDNSEDRKPSYYLEPINEDDIHDSTFAFFYNCFEDIQKHDEVKNVVINIADNGGGSAAALISVLGFLSEDGEVRFTDLDMIGNSYREEYYHVDTNLDGAADDQDGFGDRYDFYIMCSGYSYSCANALPYFAQQDGLARIIGANSGGGDCVVGYLVDAYGRCSFYSGSLKLGRIDSGSFVSNENAVQVDFNMMPSIVDVASVPWYDPEGIADAVHRCAAGETAMTFDSAEETQRIVDFLQGLIRKQPAAEEAAPAQP